MTSSTNAHRVGLISKPVSSRASGSRTRTGSHPPGVGHPAAPSRPGHPRCGAGAGPRRPGPPRPSTAGRPAIRRCPPRVAARRPASSSPTPTDRGHPALPARIAAAYGSFAEQATEKMTAEQLSTPGQAKAQAASDQAWFTPRSSCPQGPSAGSRFGPESGWAPSPTGSRSRSPQPVKGRHVTDRWWAAGAPGNGRKNPRRICGNAVPRLPKRIHCACGDGHHHCGAASLAARGRGPEIRVHDGLHRFSVNDITEPR